MIMRLGSLGKLRRMLRDGCEFFFGMQGLFIFLTGPLLRVSLLVLRLGLHRAFFK